MAIEEGGVQTCSPEIPFVIDRVDNPLANSPAEYNIAMDFSRESFYDAKREKDEHDEYLSLNPPHNCRFDMNNPETRMLTKAYGPRLRIQFSGMGRRFGVVMFSQTIGAGIALLGIAVVITDAFAKYIPGFKKKKYDLWKFEEHVDEEGDLIKSYLGEEDFNRGGSQRQQKQKQKAECRIDIAVVANFSKNILVFLGTEQQQRRQQRLWRQQQQRRNLWTRKRRRK